MFERPVGPEAKEEKSKEHCFVVLINSSMDEYSKKNFLESPFDFGLNEFERSGLNYLLFNNCQKYFTLHERLDVCFEADIRISVELNMSLDKLNILLNSIYSEWHGKKFVNNEALDHAKKTIKSSFVDTHVDIKDRKNEQWCRNDKIKPQPSRMCCIL